jgi:hypothetical protein
LVVGIVVVVVVVVVVVIVTTVRVTIVRVTIATICIVIITAIVLIIATQAKPPPQTRAPNNYQHSTSQARSRKQTRLYNSCVKRPRTPTIITT